jgi:hypothetical protein
MRRLRSDLIIPILGLVLLIGTNLRPAGPRGSQAGRIISSDRGLHGYISFRAARPPARSEFSAGMGFYSAVWPLIGEPIAHFQIGLPSAWITPDNSDNTDTPLAPVGT